ncbi:uncharacterized protein LOC143554532 [Bidens hawaiensis]|uniref:uncharacterized protein LOC143554532 n=1 Tax=Bidens hawaiensis TaxID=980011 RepID=UPI00404A5BB7
MEERSWSLEAILDKSCQLFKKETGNKNFAQWLLDIEEGKFGGPNDGKVKIEIPDDLLIKKCDDLISSLIQFVYPNILNNIEDTDYFQKRALLAPTNEIVNELKDQLIESFPGEHLEYLSSDYVSKSDYIDGNIDPTIYSAELLNGLKIPRLSNHQLILKVGVPVALLRNIDQRKWLCNGTGLRVVSLPKLRPRSVMHMLVPQV